jgi:hypothetical protein
MFVKNLNVCIEIPVRGDLYPFSAFSFLFIRFLPLTHSMTPAEYQKMIDYLDKYHSQGQIPVNSPCPDNARIEKEWQVIKLALEAIRCNGLAAQVRAVRLSQSKESLEN